VLTGEGVVRELLAAELDQQGVRRPLVVCGQNVSRSPLLAIVDDALGGATTVYDGCRPHVPIETVDAGAAFARDHGADGLIALGGSSAVDCAMGIGVLLHRGIEHLHDIPPLQFGSLASAPALPSTDFLPVATVTGTLSFAEMFGFFGARSGQRKRPYLGHNDVVRTVFLDGLVAAHTPSHIWVETGVKALDDALFTFCNHTVPEPFLDPTIADAIGALVELLPASMTETSVRQQVQIAVWMTKSHQPRLGRPSLPGWFSTAARHALGAVLDVPHGVGSCVALLPGIDFHAPATHDRQLQLARSLGWPEGGPAPLLPGLREMFARLGVPTRLRGLGYDRAAVDEVIQSIVEESPALAAAGDLRAACEAMW
jgi:maleylacetate reductase